MLSISFHLPHILCQLEPGTEYLLVSCVHEHNEITQKRSQYPSMRVRSLIRRLLSLKVTTVWAFLYHQFPGSKPSSKPSKHIKIDDEESQAWFDDSLPVKRRSILDMALITLLILLILVVLLAYVIYKPPNLLICFFQWHNPDVLFHVPLAASQKIVALTIDDAPSSSTAQILDLLSTYNASATFFIIGSQVSSHSSITQQIHASGHELGNHAWNDEPSLSLPLSELSRQITELDALLPANVNGKRYFRPGSGVFSQKMVDMVGKLGYRTVLGSIYPHDPQIHNPRVNAKHVLSMVRPGGIIIMHDRRSYSVEQLELILKGLKKEGWKVVNLGGLLAEKEALGQPA